MADLRVEAIAEALRQHRPSVDDPWFCECGWGLPVYGDEAVLWSEHQTQYVLAALRVKGYVVGVGPQHRDATLAAAASAFTEHSLVPTQDGLVCPSCGLSYSGAGVHHPLAMALAAARLDAALAVPEKELGT